MKINTGSAPGGSVRDGGPAWEPTIGIAGERFTSANASAADAAVTDTPASAQRLTIAEVWISVEAAMRVDLKEETSGKVLASLYMAANTTIPWVPRSMPKLAAAKRLMVRTSVTGNIAVTAGYILE